MKRNKRLMYRLELLEKQLIVTPTGRMIRDLFEAYAPEVMMLINHNKRVALVWHRNAGPRYIHHAVRSGMEQGFSVPEEVDGIRLPTLLRRMAAVLQDHGSPGLRRVIGEHAALVLNWAQRCTSLRQVFEEIRMLDSGSENDPDGK